MERVHNVNLHALTYVRKWDTKRIIAYKDTINKHISQLEHNGYCEDDSSSMEQAIVNLQRFKNYKEELKKILATREHID